MTNHDDPVLSPEDQLHADLCALAFGELEAGARVALEARIENEPAVRAEYDAVRATIGLVQSNLGGDDALPAERMAAVMAAAQGGGGLAPIHQLSWYQRPAVKMAAAAVLLAGVGLVGLRVFDRGQPAPEEDTRVVDGALASAEGTGAREDGAEEEEPAALDGAARRGAPLEKASAVDRRAATLVDQLQREAEVLNERLDRGESAADARVLRLQLDGGVEASAIDELSAVAATRESLGRATRGGSADRSLAEGLSPSDPGGSSSYLRSFTSGGVRRSGEVQYVDPDTETTAHGGFNAGSTPPGATFGIEAGRGANVALGGGGGRFVGAITGPAASGQPQADPSALGGLGYAGGDGGTYRGPGDTQPPAAVQPPATATRARRGLARGEADVPGAASSGSDDLFLGQGVRPEAQRRQGEAAPSGPAPTAAAPSGSAAPAEAEPVRLGGQAGGTHLGRRPVDAPTTTTVTPTPGAAPAPADQSATGPAAEPEAESKAGLALGSTSVPVEKPALELGEVVVERELERRARKKAAKVELGDDEDALSDSLRGYYDQSKNPRLTEQQLEAMAAERWRYVHDECRRMPNERPRDMYFRFWGDNPFVEAAKDAQSTFAADVDTASYALARRMLREGRLPVKAQIRTEEFVNAFSPDLPAPTEGTFGLHMELAPSPFSQDAYGEDAGRYLVRVGVRGKDVAPEDRQPLNLTFVVDTSGSMREGGRLELVKHAMRLLVNELEPRDTIAVVAYSNEARQILLPTPASNRNLIETAIHPLSPNGSTNAEAGLKMGYALAETMLKPGTHNRVVFLSDGVANVGQTDQNRIADDVKRLREKGIYLNTIGVGMSNHNDVFLEQLANKGDGICDYVDDAKGAEEAIVERFTGAFIAIAGDVKLQVEFDPTQVVRWRQLGYENRAVADKDFRNDKVDAGEVGAGHQVTCLYEVELAQPAEGADVGDLATLRVRWKAPREANQDPSEVDVFEEETGLSRGALVASFDAASPGFRRSAYAAQFAEFLRRSSHARHDSYGDLVAGIGSLMDASRSNEPFMKELVELADLVRRADGLGLSRRMPVSDLERSIEAYKRYQYLKATLDDLERAQDDDVLRQLEDTNRQLENQIRDLIRRDLEEKHG